MLSQETATGVDPVNVVRTMAAIISEEEHYAKMDTEQLESLMEENLSNPVLTAVSGFKNSAATLLLDASGTLYPALSKWSRTIPSILVTKSLKVARHATLYKNIIPLIIKEDLDRDQTVLRGIEMALQFGIIREGDLISVVEGPRLTKSGMNQNGALQIMVVPKSTEQL
jgi:pyruvate kinase